MHGGSGAHQEDIEEVIKMGVVKININTELRLAFANGLRLALQDPNEIVPYKYLQKALETVKMVVEGKIKLFYGKNKIRT